jgi:hypothetical protein
MAGNPVSLVAACRRGNSLNLGTLTPDLPPRYATQIATHPASFNKNLPWMNDYLIEKIWCPGSDSN